MAFRSGTCWRPRAMRQALATGMSASTTRFVTAWWYSVDLTTVSINLEGVSAGAEPRTVAENLRNALASSFSKKYASATAEFASLEDNEKKVVLRGATLPTA